VRISELANKLTLDHRRGSLVHPFPCDEKLCRVIDLPEELPAIVIRATSVPVGSQFVNSLGETITLPAATGFTEGTFANVKNGRAVDPLALRGVCGVNGWTPFSVAVLEKNGPLGGFAQNNVDAFHV
jgi:hypothetical protein